MSDRFYLGKSPLPLDLLKSRFLLDANVWLYLQGPVQDHLSRPARAYSRFFGEVIKAGGAFLLPQVVATEFVNRSLSILAEASGWNRRDGKLHARQEYPQWMSDACDGLHAIVGDSERVDDQFTGADLDGIYAEASGGARLDFNDHLIGRLARTYGAVLVTHDSDFAGYDLPIVTANGRLD